MSKKKVENLLKGVAITGATVGGASVLGDANLAYAAELGEEQAAANAEGVIVLETTQVQAEQVVETTVQSVQQETVEVEAVAESTTQIEEVDLDSLNKAIKDLSTIIAPLAKLFKR